MNHNFIDEIKSNGEIIECNVCLRKYNTMRLNSVAKYMIKPRFFLELKKILVILKKYNINYHIIGNGSNILFTGKEKECIIKLDFNKNKEDFILMSNELLPVVSDTFAKKGFSGFETLSSIPASIGGAIVMNAGAYGNSISDIIEYIYVLDKDLKFRVIGKEDCRFEYRNSVFKKNNWIVLGCKVKLIKDQKENIIEKMKYVTNKRKETQPLEHFNSGSIFKNPEGYKAWELISFLNLQGLKKNDAKVSEKHANFIVNLNNASYEDIIYIINYIKKKVNNKFYIKLENEVVIID